MAKLIKKTSAKTATEPVKPAAAPAVKEEAPVKAAAKPVEKKAPVKKAAVKKEVVKKVKAPAKTKAKVEKVEFDALIADLKKKSAGFDAKSYQGFLAIQVTLKDLKKDFYVEIKDGSLSIEPYDYIDHQAKIIMKSTDFVKMINGQLNSTTAFLTRKLVIERDIEKAKELSKLFNK